MRTVPAQFVKRRFDAGRLNFLSHLRIVQRCALVVVCRSGRLRFFVVRKTGRGVFRPTLYGEVKPMSFGSRKQAFLSFSHVRNWGRFCQVEVPRVLQRRGLAEDMVHALMKVYPDSYFWNQNLNEASGPLFVKMSGLYPNQIAPVTLRPDGSFVLPSYGNVVGGTVNVPDSKRAAPSMILVGTEYREV